MISVNVGKNIAELRKAKGITAEQLSEALRVTRQTVSKWEKGITVPDAYRMVDLATFLDIPVSDIYTQIFYEKSNNKLGINIDEIMQIIDPKDIKKAISAYDKSVYKLNARIGVNIITYKDILLLSTNMGYFKGYSEIDNPVSYHEAKNQNVVIPELVQYLKSKDLITFYAGGQFDPPVLPSYQEHNESNEGDQVLVIIRNEKELLDFKTAIKELFTGIVSIDCKRDWRSSSGMKYLLCMHEKDKELDKFEEKYNQIISSGENLTKENQAIMEKARKIIEELREEELEEHNPIQYIKDEKELTLVRKQLSTLDEKMMKEFAEACFGFEGIETIMILDLEAKKYLPL